MYTTLVLTRERPIADGGDGCRQGEGRDATTICKQVITNIHHESHYRPLRPFSLVSLTLTLLLNYNLTAIVSFTLSSISPTHTS